ncbi:MAG: CDP-alcohol phosphatidyltransferase family protein [Gammaproteobacteria bacterium]|nr:CDP-alcohol phosphatidyltransferase family protein [Gammaproteobacteria bacterium]
MTGIPRTWDARLAARLVAPLRDSAVTPNHLTTLRFAVGAAGALLFATGGAATPAALLIALSSFLDHADGELARMSGKSSRWGHYYDLASDFIVVVGLFAGIGIGLSDGELGRSAIGMGALAGVAIALMFHLRNEIERDAGKDLTRQPTLGGFEPEDVFYLLPVVTLLDGLTWFLIAAAVGAPTAAAVVVCQYLRFRRDRAPPARQA